MAMTYKVFHGRGILPEDHGRRVIWLLSLGLGVNTFQLQLSPHEFQELVDVPPVLRTDRTGIRNAIEQIQLFDRDRVDFI